MSMTWNKNLLEFRTQQIIAYPTRLIPLPAGQSVASVGRSTSWDAKAISPANTADGSCKFPIFDIDIVLADCSTY
jgi:hypothetical protein